MSAFRLFLCLAGLAVYVLIKQFMLAGGPRPSEHPVRGGIDKPAVMKPQTHPHTEILKASRGLLASSSGYHLTGPARGAEAGGHSLR